MSILLGIVAILLGSVAVGIFWWAMIEAQEQAGIENENRRVWKLEQDEDDRRCRRERNKR